MKVYFSHGKKNGPTDAKLVRLEKVAKKYNLETVIIDSSNTINPDERVNSILEIIKNEKENEFILVGSSMGGYVSLLAAEEKIPKSLFLIAPACYMPNYKQQVFTPLKLKNFEIVHGWTDTVVPVEKSIRYAKETLCTLHLISANHNFDEAIESIAILFDSHLKKALS
jgi:alpha/beta superfamily hydrolase